MKLANRANPTHSEAMLVRSRAGLALAAMSTSGEATLRSISTNTASRTAATASSPIVRGAPQPHTAGLAQRQQQAEQGHGEQDRAGEVEPADPALGRLG